MNTISTEKGVPQRGPASSHTLLHPRDPEVQTAVVRGDLDPPPNRAGVGYFGHPHS